MHPWLSANKGAKLSIFYENEVFGRQVIISPGNFGKINTFSYLNDTYLNDIFFQK